MQRTTRIAFLFATVWLGLAWLLVARNWMQLKDPLILESHYDLDIRKSWGAYSPFYSVQEYIPPPDGCELTQVCETAGFCLVQLQRHGARFPTFGASINIVSALRKLQIVDRYAHPAMEFLSSFIYTLGTEDLVSFGAQQSYQAGATVFERYGNLVDADNLPFVRAPSGGRVVDSANNWTAGFSAASHHKYNPRLSVIFSKEVCMHSESAPPTHALTIYEDNDTLENNMCPNAGTSTAQTAEWLARYAPPITARLNSWAPGANLTDPETSALASLCAFHTVASASASASFAYAKLGTLSPFCALFTPSDFTSFDYYHDLDKYYYTGYGAPRGLGRVQGVGYVNELLARLTRSPVRDETQTNRTLDADLTTFPLNRTVYTDFSGDNTMVAIFGALGLFRQPRTLSTTQPDARRTWRTHEMVPFSGRMVVEKLACEDGGEYVRILVNDALQPLSFCASESDPFGAGSCTLSAFIKSQTYARSNGGGDWERCFS
ncbi:Phosphoglycerate mutase-like protein [Mycena venus]|uniref:Phytase A n=1 Tax=Mycena venus TaxID=2733690 RepID=A0A8H6XCB4_9AGAR|nr:Phosphoglycerate mutase-like protein [Mycena venus]